MASISTIVTTYQLADEEMDAIRSAVPNADLIPFTTDEQLARDIPRADVVVGGPLKDALLDVATNLRWHHVPWAGVENFQQTAYRERGILLTNASGTNAIPIAEHIIAMMLAFARGIPGYAVSTRQHTWRGWSERPDTFELTDATVVLLGTGEIGKATADRLRPFGCEIVGIRRSADQVAGFDKVFPYTDLAKAVSDADHVISSLPLTEATRGIVSRQVIQAMKQGAHFYNVGRGGTVDQAALVQALENGHLAGAGLDVTTPEPLPEDDPLWSAPNVLITGHTAGGSPLTRQRSAALLKEAIHRYLADQTIPTAINLEEGY